MTQDHITKAAESARKAKDAPAVQPIDLEAAEIQRRLATHGIAIDLDQVDIDTARRLASFCGEVVCKAYGAIPKSGKVTVYAADTIVPEVVEDILRFVAEGGSLRRALARDGMPNNVMWYEWVNRDEQLAQRYAHARQCRGTINAETIEDASFDLLNDPNPTSERVQAFRAAADKLQWVAARLNKREYGDEQRVTLDATNGFIKALERVEQAAQRIDRAKAIDLTATQVRQIETQTGASD